MSTSSGDYDLANSGGDSDSRCDCDDCFLGISDIMSEVLLRGVKVRTPVVHCFF